MVIHGDASIAFQFPKKMRGSQAKAGTFCWEGLGKPAQIRPVKIIELNHVALFVSDVDRSSRYYQQLGLSPIPRPAFDFPGAWFRIGAGQELHLIGDRLAGPITKHSRTGHFAMRVGDLELVAKKLREKGVAFAEPARRPDGARQIFLEDP